MILAHHLGEHLLFAAALGGAPAAATLALRTQLTDLVRRLRRREWRL